MEVYTDPVMEVFMSCQHYRLDYSYLSAESRMVVYTDPVMEVFMSTLPSGLFLPVG